jgi:aminopeptidase
MNDPRTDRLARVLVDYSAGVRPGDLVAIQSGPAAAPLVRAAYRAALEAGGLPYVFTPVDGLDEILLKEGTDDQLKHVSRVDKMVRTDFDVLIAIQCSENTRGLSSVPPERQRIRTKAYTGLREVFMARSASGAFRWVSTLYPTSAYAQDAEMSLSEFADFVYGATYADDADPVARWNEVQAEQQRYVDYLHGKRSLHVQGPDVDMTLSIEGRTFINSDGRHNMPSGEIFTGPVEDSVEGWVRFSFPAVTSGREVHGVELRFERGRIVRATAKKNEEFLLATLDTDDGARYLGEWAIGTNRKIQRFTKNILFDEKIGGTIHMAVGAGYPETGSLNKSAVHWDMICDMRGGGTIAADGEVFYRSGAFVI